MESTLKALIVKKFKDSELDLDVGRHWIDELPKMRRAGRTDVSDLAVSVKALTPVSEPRYAVA